MGNLLQDVRYGIRRLLKQPIITIVAIISLGLGIGANTSIFSVVNAVLLRPLPYQDSGRLVFVWETNSQAIAALMGIANHNQVAAANYLDWTKQNQSFEGMAAIRFLNFNLSCGYRPCCGRVGSCTQSYFVLLG